VRLTRGLGTSAASLPMNSSGLNTTWVVPSSYGVFSPTMTLPLLASDRVSVHFTTSFPLR
jgi:hypothetical protein